MRAVDLFAGAGGTTTGATWAGARVLAAVNHWRRAVESHSAAHPGVVHHCEDAAILDPTTLPARAVDALRRLGREVVALCEDADVWAVWP